MIEQYDLLQSV